MGICMHVAAFDSSWVETSTSHGHHLACAEQLHQLDNLTLEAYLSGEKQNKFSQPFSQSFWELVAL